MENETVQLLKDLRAHLAEWGGVSESVLSRLNIGIAAAHLDAVRHRELVTAAGIAKTTLRAVYCNFPSNIAAKCAAERLEKLLGP